MASQPEIGSLRPIGIVRTAYHDPNGTPVQSSLALESTGTIELEPRYSDALLELDGFDCAWLLTWLGAPDTPNREVKLRVVPYFLSRTPRHVGYLATRSPKRINPIGLSLIRIVSVDPPHIHFAGVDVVDGTPVIDIKPYVAAFDQPRGAVRSGWFDSVMLDAGSTPNRLRPPEPTV